MNRVALAHIALISVQFIYAASFTIVKIATPAYILPFGFIVIRVAAGAMFFWLVHSIFIQEKIEGKDVGLLALCGLFGGALNQLCFFKGLSLTTAIDAGLIIIVCPILVLVFAAILLGERITWRKAFGIFLGASGAVFLILYGKNTVNNIGENRMLGNFFLFINASSYALYLVLVKSLLRKYHPITVIKWVFTFGLFLVIPFGYHQLMQVQWHTFTPTVWAAIFYVLFFVTIVTFSFNILALRVVSPATTSAYIYAQPFLAAFIAYLVRGEVVTLPQILACLLIFAGLYLVSARDKRRET